MQAGEGGRKLAKAGGGGFSRRSAPRSRRSAVTVIPPLHRPLDGSDSIVPGAGVSGGSMRWRRGIALAVTLLLLGILAATFPRDSQSHPSADDPRDVSVPEVSLQKPTPSVAQPGPIGAAGTDGNQEGNPSGDSASGAILGQVLTYEGRPVADFTVTLIRDASDFAGNMFELFSYAKTDFEGRFAFEGLPAGTHHVFAGECSLGEACPAQAAVAVENGARVEGVTLRLPPTISVEIRVVDAELNPVARAEVFLTGDPCRKAAVVTGGDGAARLELFGDADLQGHVVAPSDDSRTLMPVTFFRIPERRTSWTVVVETSATITGRVLAPEPAIESWFRLRATRNGELVSWAVSEDDGSFSLVVPSAGPVDIDAHGNWLNTNDPARRREALFGVLKGVQPGAAGVEVRTEVLQAGGRIEVLVLGPYGAPAAGAHVRARELRSGHEEQISVNGNGVGALVVSGSVPWDLFATPADSESVLEWLPARREQVVAGSEAVVLTLRQGKRVTGVVLDPEGRPTQRAQLTIDLPGSAVGPEVHLPDPEDGVPDSITEITLSPEGRFSFAIDPSLAHHVRFRAIALDGSSEVERTVDLSLGGSDIELRLLPR